MRTLLLSAAILFGGLFMSAQSNESTAMNGITVTVHVPVPGYGGSLIAGLYTEDTFMKSDPIQSQSSRIMEGYATVTFAHVLPGTYAISLFHDKNDNKVMDLEANGMPKELFGVSNNQKKTGPPQWVDAKFEVGSESIQMEIKL